MSASSHSAGSKTKASLVYILFYKMWRQVGVEMQASSKSQCLGGRGRQIPKFKASLVYIVSSRTASYVERLKREGGFEAAP